MANNFDLFFRRVLDDEGTQYEDVVGDNGGPTKCGLTCFDVAKWNGMTVPKRGAPGWDEIVKKVHEINPSSARDIYKKFYWDVVRADDLPSGLDYALADYSVNSGHGRAILTLGALLGCKDHTMTDAMIAASRSYGSLPDLIQHYQDERKAFLEKISTIPHNTKFRRGWLERVERVRKVALDLASREEPQVALKTTPKAVATLADLHGIDDTQVTQLEQPNVIISAVKSPTVLSLLAAAWASVYSGFEKAVDVVTGLLGSAGDIQSDVDAASAPLQAILSSLKINAPAIGTGIVVICVVVAIVRHVDLKRGAS